MLKVVQCPGPSVFRGGYLRVEKAFVANRHPASYLNRERILSNRCYRFELTQNSTPLAV